MIRFYCPHCSKQLEVEDAYASGRGPCPFCKQTIDVPSSQVAGSASPGGPTAAGPPAGFAGPALTPPPAPVALKTSGWSMAALICGLFSWLLIPGLLAIIFGIIGLRKVNGSHGLVKGSGLAIAGIVLGVLGGVLLGGIGLILAISIPSLGAATEAAHRAQCAANLRSIYVSIKTYAASNRQHWPTVYSKADDPRAGQETWGEKWTSPDWKVSDDGGGAVKMGDHQPFACNLSCLWLLVREDHTVPGIFNCPSDGDSEEAPLGQSSHDHWSFAKVTQCSYSYQNQLGYNTTDRVGANVIVMADKSPCRANVAGRPPARAAGSNRWQWNSPNHKWEGQNCLYGDGHVSFEKSSDVGYHDDNIWTRDEWDKAAGKWKDRTTSGYDKTGEGIVDANDSFLVP